MKSNTVVQKSPLDTVKLWLAFAIAAAGVVGFYYFGDEPPLYRVLGLLAVLGVAVAVIMTTQLGQSVWSFGRSSRTELRKVVWPNRQETTQTTLIVLVVVILVAIFLWLLDMFLRWAVGLLMGLGG